MNRSHKQQLEKLKAKNFYTKEDLEMAEELLKQEDPSFKEEVEIVYNKIKKILSLNKNHEENS
ncbi:MAG: hypothetical protein GX490_03625 [Bacilli bacterium]|nr:hypothetical protein [Bacilli bacterium]